MYVSAVKYGGMYMVRSHDRYTFDTRVALRYASLLFDRDSCCLFRRF